MNFTTPKRLWKKSDGAESEVSGVSRKEIEFSKEDAGCVFVLHSILQPFTDCNKKYIFNFYRSEYEEYYLRNLQTIGQQLPITLTEEERLEMWEETKQQSKSTLWFKVRTGRITASNLKAVCHTSIDKPCLSVIKSICYPEKGKFKQTEYGCMHDGLLEYLRQHKKIHPSAELKVSTWTIHNSVQVLTD
ncbi:hypothetical protein Zmor_001778 [Zophobas morio]|uniref:Uncharacterized protein n=1 Tax=Zophobas morio TaxID=2755281 RepID=A0AA38J9R8_9CUCU|nr:hypothetical protein Zmor_001778 [Zophobas morio]